MGPCQPVDGDESPSRSKTLSAIPVQRMPSNGNASAKAGASCSSRAWRNRRRARCNLVFTVAGGRFEETGRFLDAQIFNFAHHEDDAEHLWKIDGALYEVTNFLLSDGALGVAISRPSAERKL